MADGTEKRRTCVIAVDGSKYSTEAVTCKYLSKLGVVFITGGD